MGLTAALRDDAMTEELGGSEREAFQCKGTRVRYIIMSVTSFEKPVML